MPEIQKAINMEGILKDYVISPYFKNRVIILPLTLKEKTKHLKKIFLRVYLLKLETVTQEKPPG